MLGLVKTALHKPYTFIVLAIFICIIGPLAAVRTPTDVFPDIGIPVVAVVWQYTGLAPADMAGRVIYTYERSLSTTVNDIEHIESQSLPGMGIVKIFFQPGVDIRTANAQVTAVSQTVLKQMPPGITPPLILNYSASTVPILQLAFSSPTLSEAKIRDLVQNNIRLPLSSLPGLAMLGGESVDAALQAVIDGKADAIVVLENDLFTRVDAVKVNAALDAAKVVIVADHQKTATTDRANLVLPAASFAEGDGTLVSQEGRAQRFFQVFDPKYMDASILVHEGWRWLHALRATLLNQPIDWTQLDHVTAATAASAPQLARIIDAAPSAAFRIKGMKLAREPLRYSGRTAMRANISVHEPQPLPVAGIQ